MQLVITGPDASTKRLDLKEHAVTIGRAPDNVLSYPSDPDLSRYHLSIEPFAGGWQVRDCGSRNGTVVNSTAVTGSQALHAGDRIYAGQLTLELVKLPTTVSERVVTFSPPEDAKQLKRGAEARGFHAWHDASH
jgi:pSer/pThr/pTyr-binding forkhead associated (FHA) protein